MRLIEGFLEEPLFLLFLILFLGSWLGQAKVKGLSLGSAGVLLIAMVLVTLVFKSPQLSKILV